MGQYAISSEYDGPDYHSFQAIRGIQAGREYYVAMCPLGLIPNIFVFNESNLPSNLRAQRTLNKSRIPEIVRYLTGPNSHYVLSSITASIDGKLIFTPLEEKGALSKLGMLRVPVGSRILINDGQHRKAAIEQALKKKPELSKEHISVVFYQDAGLKQSQQMFSDLNKHAIKPTTSLNILYDHNDIFGQAVVSLLQDVPIFSSDLTELEKTSISNRKNKVFTLNSIHNATRALLGKTAKKPGMTNSERELTVEFWNEVNKNMLDWNSVLDGTLTPYEARRDCVSVYGVLLHAIGHVGHDLIKAHPVDWKKKLTVLKKINWTRANSLDWEGRSLLGGRLTKARNNTILTSNLIKIKLNLELNVNERALEGSLSKRR